MPVIPSTTQVVSPNLSAKKIIKRALRIIGAKQSNEEPTKSELQDALEALNAMLDSWNTEKLIVWAIVRNAYALTSNQNGHTIGIGADFDVPIPSRIDNVALIISGQTIESPLRFLTDDEYAGIPDKTQTGPPTSVWFDGAHTFYFFPVPDGAHTFVLYDDVQLSQISDFNAQFTLPTGYKRAIDHNLAVELAPEFGVALSDIADVVQTANIAKANLKARNIKPVIVRCDTALAPRAGRNFDVYTGRYR